MKFNTIIMNPPYSSTKIHYAMIKRVRQIAKSTVVIIPSKEGNIPLSSFSGCTQFKYLNIYKLKMNEPLKYEIWTKTQQSKFYINVPRQSFLMKKYFETGDFKSYGGDYCTFSFYSQSDLTRFKDRLFKKDWNKVKGFLSPNYEDILIGINYVKKYRSI